MKTNRCFAIVVSRFNQSITQKLLNGALASLKKHHVPEKAVEVVWVPGAYEIPLMAQSLAKSKKFQAVICLGCVLKGQTPHNLYIAEAVANGIMNAALTTGIPITFGILTPNTYAQALARSGDNSANKGSEAAEAAFEMAQLLYG
jgi:6,7-dimethyl-8-ribityllumazine synthase